MGKPHIVCIYDDNLYIAFRIFVPAGHSDDVYALKYHYGTLGHFVEVKTFTDPPGDVENIKSMFKTLDDPAIQKAITSGHILVAEAVSKVADATDRESVDDRNSTARKADGHVLAEQEIDF